ncbi:alpha beta hydrolase fold-3 domain-containing protein [Diplodia corticola]|uniref:Alpha beta hydrolase fold-3 domain-containing protein n=1 Tax=Diplodia corticola TaxID=236234 RepID=A0A1J9SET3_9PEZI|nr:alpha beta hydrolase fold-3 domain-containing protein [Diplodia corticola]OJD38919.1 alpha beta hydrolase fold-3 domain-containing protein [Diplodia corticola]
MPLVSDLVLDDSKFDDSRVSSATAALNEKLTGTQASIPKWHEVGPEKFRQLCWNKPVVIESGVDFKLPSRDSGRDIPCRVFKPAGADVRGVLMHIHGGGFVLCSEKYSDTYIKTLADSCQLAVVSIGYRLAPEHPYPAALDDCVDAAEWLARKAKPNYGAELMFIGGHSAGANLCVLTVLHFLKVHSSFPLRGLLLQHGVYDLSHSLPQATNYGGRGILDLSEMARFTDAYLPGRTQEQRRDPTISPLYENLRQFGRAALPPALFTCWTEDPLLDDTLMMAIKWRCTGSEGITKIFAGAPHAFALFPPSVCEHAAPALDVTQQFILEKLA